MEWFAYGVGCLRTYGWLEYVDSGDWEDPDLPAVGMYVLNWLELGIQEISLFAEIKLIGKVYFVG